MQKILFILTLMVLSIINLAKAMQNYEDKCEIFTECQMCLNGNKLASWLLKRSEKYGNTLEIVRALRSLSKGKPENNIDKEFYARYGAFFFIYHATGRYENNEKLKVLSLLLKNGVHPYMKIPEEMNIVQAVINANDMEAFSIILESGLLLDCEFELEKLLSYTQNDVMSYYFEQLSRLLAESHLQNNCGCVISHLEVTRNKT